jgi:hypothetical protein
MMSIRSMRIGVEVWPSPPFDGRQRLVWHGHRGLRVQPVANEVTSGPAAWQGTSPLRRAQDDG